jgi:cytokinin dehydrogenase
MYSDFEVFRKDQEMLISSSATTTSMPADQQEQLLMTFDFIEGFVVMNTEDPINGWKSVPFSPDQMTASMLPPDAGSVLYYLEITVGYNLEDVGPALEEVSPL